MNRIKDIMPYGGSLSLFNALASYAPWGTDINAGRLDLLYLSHSGNKICGAVIDVLTDDGESEFTSTMMSTLGRTIADFYANKWQRLWDVMSAEYEPLENYNMVENGEITESENQKSTGESTGSATGNNGNSLYGFASTTKVSSDENESESATASTSTGESDRTAESKHTLTRNGNIGIRSSQELLTQEIELWQWEYFETVFNDIDKIITLEIY